jgi:DNA-binding CsgD family transcriptional regulator
VSEDERLSAEALTARQVAIIQLRSEGMSLETIGKHVGISRSRVRYILKRAERRAKPGPTERQQP